MPPPPARLKGLGSRPGRCGGAAAGPGPSSPARRAEGAAPGPRRPQVCFPSLPGGAPFGPRPRSLRPPGNPDRVSASNRKCGGRGAVRGPRGERAAGCGGPGLRGRVGTRPTGAPRPGPWERPCSARPRAPGPRARLKGGQWKVERRAAPRGGSRRERGRRFSRRPAPFVLGKEPEDVRWRPLPLFNAEISCVAFESDAGEPG